MFFIGFLFFFASLCYILLENKELKSENKTQLKEIKNLTKLQSSNLVYILKQSSELNKYKRNQIDFGEMNHP